MRPASEVISTLPHAAVLTHDVREGGRWTPLQAVKNAILYRVVRGTLAMSSLLPPSWLRAFGRALGRLAYTALPQPRRTALENLARAFPELDSKERRNIAYRAYVELGGYLGDATGVLAGRPLPPLPIASSSRRELESALGEGRGVIFASAHLGPWERVAGSLVAHGVPLTTIAREGYDARLTPILDRLRSVSGVRSIYRGSPSAPLQILRTLRKGGVLGAPMDLRSRVPSVTVPLFGTPADTAVGPARLALRTGAPLVVGTAAPAPFGLQITMTRIDTAGLAANARDEATLTARINTELSRRILAFPEGWVWMHARW